MRYSEQIRRRERCGHNPNVNFFDLDEFAINHDFWGWIGDYGHFTRLPLQELLSQFARGDGIRNWDIAYL